MRSAFCAHTLDSSRIHRELIADSSAGVSMVAFAVVDKEPKVAGGTSCAVGSRAWPRAEPPRTWSLESSIEEVLCVDDLTTP